MFIRIGIRDSGDNTGDGGLQYELLDETGAELLAGAARESGWLWLEKCVPAAKGYVFRLIDKDTRLTGGLPGNGGSIIIQVRPINALAIPEGK